MKQKYMIKWTFGHECGIFDKDLRTHNNSIRGPAADLGDEENPRAAKHPRLVKGISLKEYSHKL